MTRILAAGLGLLLTACSSPGRPGRPGTGPPTGPEASPRAPVAGKPAGTVSSSRPVADHFSPAPADPGPSWTRAGRPVESRELSSVAGPRHCQWQSAVLLHLGWPPGTVSRSGAEVRQFVRDPDRVIGYGVRDGLAVGVGLPDDARDTGYRTGSVELWLAPSVPQAAFLRSGSDVERWPRADPVVACR